MLQHPKSGQQLFEVAVYNKQVRALVKENQSHRLFDDQWADIQLRDVLAKDEVEARHLMNQKFPPDDGFVIQDVTITTAII